MLNLDFDLPCRTSPIWCSWGSPGGWFWNLSKLQDKYFYLLCNFLKYARVYRGSSVGLIRIFTKLVDNYTKGRFNEKN